MPRFFRFELNPFTGGKYGTFHCHVSIFLNFIFGHSHAYTKMCSTGYVQEHCLNVITFLKLSVSCGNFKSIKISDEFDIDLCMTFLTLLTITVSLRALEIVAEWHLSDCVSTFCISNIFLTYIIVLLFSTIKQV